MESNRHSEFNENHSFPTIPWRNENEDDGVGPDHSNTLGRTIRARMETSLLDSEGRKFLPINQLSWIITRNIIREELQRRKKDANPDELNRLTDQIWEDGPVLSSKPSGLITRCKIFAILILVNLVPAIEDFIGEGLDDSDLPLIFQDGTGHLLGSFDVYRKLKGGEGEPDYLNRTQCFRKGQDSDLENFSRCQWQLLAPHFSFVSNGSNEVPYYDLRRDIILPFIKDGNQEPPAQYGGSADVFRVKIHRSHHDLRTSDNDDENPSFAVKQLHSNDHDAFQQEVSTLKRFTGKNHHPHLIKLLLTYRYQGHYHLLFHWADSNLLDYWKRYPEPDSPTRDYKFAKWMSRQWLGVVEGLQAIHLYTSHPTLPFRDSQYPSDPRIHGRHGDLKPENILWYERPHLDQGASDYLGLFVISDFGLTRFHRSKTKSQVNPMTLGRSLTYRAPEYDIQNVISQSCDIWALGCVLLEFLIWYFFGWKGVEDFSKKRADEDGAVIREDVFFNFIQIDQWQKSARCKKSVADAFELLRGDPRTTQFFLDILDLVEERLLRMNPDKRAKCEEIVDKFKYFNKRCSQDDSYCTDPVSKPKRASTNLSELVATPPRSFFLEMQRQLDGRVEEVGHAGLINQHGPPPLSHGSQSVTSESELESIEQEETQSFDEMIKNGDNLNTAQEEDTSMKTGTHLNSPKMVHFERGDQVIPPFMPNDLGSEMNNNNAEYNNPRGTQNKKYAYDKHHRDSTEAGGPSQYNSVVHASQPSFTSENRCARDGIEETRLIETRMTGEQLIIEPVNSQKVLDMNGDPLAKNVQPYAPDRGRHHRHHHQPDRFHRLASQGSSSHRPADIHGVNETSPLSSHPSFQGSDYNEAETSGSKKWYRKILCCC